MYQEIFSKGRERILEVFYKNKGKELYFREIVRQAKLTQPAVLNHLKLLEGNNLSISTKKTGNTFYKANTSNPQMLALFSYFDTKRFNELPAERKQALKDFFDSLEEQPIISFLFGSTARGNFKEDSDIDVLLIVNKKFDTREAEKKSEAHTGIKIQVFIVLYDDFINEIKLKRDNTLQSALAYGYPITNNIKFYEVLHNEN